MRFPRGRRVSYWPLRCWKINSTRLNLLRTRGRAADGCKLCCFDRNALRPVPTRPTTELTHFDANHLATDLNFLITVEHYTRREIAKELTLAVKSDERLNTPSTAMRRLILLPRRPR